MNAERKRELSDGIPVGAGPIVYWMSRDIRIHDNWALLTAQELAIAQGQPLIVLYTLAGDHIGCTRREYDFMLRGLEKVEHSLAQYHIPFLLREGKPSESVLTFTRSIQAGAIITDFDPLRTKRKWNEQVVAKSKIALFEVDAHNIVPTWIASNKLEYGAHTFRPKIHLLFPTYLEKFPRLKKHPQSGNKKMSKTDWKHVHRWRKVDESVQPVDWILPGEHAANEALNNFIRARLVGYDANRNDPTQDKQSNLSPYIHYGQLAAQRVALEVEKSDAPSLDKEAFLEELIVRRELAENYCYYNPHYDRSEGFPDWAKKTIAEHKGDKREYIYSQLQFEHAQTHDQLWNAAQIEMTQHGKMHGYMRMYWAKKILEWTKSVDVAMEIAIYLNDKYELDGHDPSGYTGIAWSIGGVHDRAWADRPVFGQIRYMNASGCRKKFDVDAYIARWIPS
jgi:deoxyribodipyrimidine photo-lyase